MLSVDHPTLRAIDTAAATLRRIHTLAEDEKPADALGALGKLREELKEIERLLLVEWI